MTQPNDALARYECDEVVDAELIDEDPPARKCPQCGDAEYVIDDQVCWEDDDDAVRFTLDHPNGASSEEIARAFNVTRQRINQIEHNALRKLRLVLRMNPQVLELFIAKSESEGPRHPLTAAGEAA